MTDTEKEMERKTCWKLAGMYKNGLLSLTPHLDAEGRSKLKSIIAEAESFIDDERAKMESRSKSCPSKTR